MKPRMTSKSLLVTLWAGVAAACLAADYEFSEWLTDVQGGSGGWADTTRWKDGKLPSSTRNVLIVDADAWITDVDAAILNSLTRIRFDGKSASLELRFAEDHGVKINSIQELDSQVKGRLFKTGAGSVTLTNQNDSTLSEIVVSNGTLLVDSGLSKIAVSKTYVVAKGAILAFNEAANFSLPALVADGVVTNVNAQAKNVTLSVGTLTHTDDSPWTLPEKVRPMDDIVARNGTFVLHQPLYTYYRIIFKENGGDQYLQTYGLRMNDAQTNYVNSEFSYNSAANGDTSKLNAGEIAYHDTGTWTESGSGRGVAMLAYGSKKLFSVSHGGPVKETIPATWVGAILRLKEYAPAVVSYDFATHCSSNPNRTPRKWTFEGSRDGKDWDLLHSYSTNALPTSDHNRWVSSDTADFVSGFPVAVGPAQTFTSRTLPRVTLSDGAALVAEYAAEIDALVLDCTSGGTVDGCTFAAEGTLDLVGLTPGFSGEITTVSFANVTGLENLAGWMLLKGGKPCRGKVVVKEGKLCYESPGMIMIFR